VGRSAPGTARDPRLLARRLQSTPQGFRHKAFQESGQAEHGPVGHDRNGSLARRYCFWLTVVRNELAIFSQQAPVAAPPIMLLARLRLLCSP